MESLNDSDILTLQCSPIDNDTTDEIFEFINDGNADEEEEEEERLQINDDGWNICDIKYQRIRLR